MTNAGGRPSKALSEAGKTTHLPGVTPASRWALHLPGARPTTRADDDGGARSGDLGEGREIFLLGLYTPKMLIVLGKACAAKI